jgi:hypothetical protein
MQAHVEGAIGNLKQHSRTSLLHANKPTRFWDDATKVFSIKKVYVWASPYTCGKLETPHDVCSRLSLALTKPLPYLSEAESSLNCLVSTAWSRTDHLVIVSGTYLCSDSATPCISMFSIALQRKIKMQEIKSYPFKDPSYLMCKFQGAQSS